MKMNMKKINFNKSISFIVFAVVFCFVSVGFLFPEGKEFIPVIEVITSDTTRPQCPGMYLFDEDPGTAWGFKPAATNGWAEIELNANYLVYGIKMSAELPNAVLSIEYEKNGSWESFAGIRIENLNATDHFMDLSYDRIVTGKIALRITGGELSTSRLTECKIYGSFPGNILQKIKPKRLYAGDKNRHSETIDKLIDGNVWSAWGDQEFYDDDFKNHGDGISKVDNQSNFIDAAFGNDLKDIIKEIKQKAFRCEIKNQLNEGEVLFDFGSEYNLDGLHIYVNSLIHGDITFYYNEKNNWKIAHVLSEIAETGWQIIDFDSGTVITDGIKMKVNSYHNSPGLISEIEFWGYGDYTGDEYIPFGLPGPVGLIKPINLVGQNIKSDDGNRDLEIVITGNISDMLKIDLNEHTLSAAPYVVIQNHTVYRFPLSDAMLWEQDNFLRIYPIEGRETRFLMSRIRDNTEIGIFKEIGAELNDDLLFTSSNVENGIYEFNKSLLIRRIEIYSDTEISVDLLLMKNNEWISCNPVASENEVYVFKPGFIANGLMLETRGISGPAEIRIFASPTKDQPPNIRILWPNSGYQFGDNFDRYFYRDKDDYDRSHHSEDYGDYKNGSRDIDDHYFNDKDDERGYGIFVFGYVDNPNAVVTINDIPAKQSGHYFWIRFSDLNISDFGIYTIKAVATDEKGRQDEQEITVTIGEFQAVFLNQPDEIIYTDKEEFDISGRVTSNKYGIKINSEIIRVNKRKFTHPVNLIVGMNIISIDAFDITTDKVVQRIYRKVYKYNNELFLTIDHPMDRMYITDEKVVVSGTVYGLGDITVNVNGMPATVFGMYYKLNDLILKEGENKIVVTARDSRGNTREEQIIVYRDSIEPVITNISPPDNHITSISSVKITGTVSDASPVYVYVNDVAADVKDNAFNILFKYEDGIWPIRVLVVDIAGNTAPEYKFSIMVDTKIPAPFTIKADPAGWTANNRPVITFGTTDATSGIDRYELSIDNGIYLVVESPYQLPELEDGIHSISVNAYDRAGNHCSADTKVFIDTTPPAVPEVFRPVPGNGEVTVKCASHDLDITSYIIERHKDGEIITWEYTGFEIIHNKDEEDTNIDTFQSVAFLDDDLENGDTVNYRVWGIDRAGNVGLPTALESVEVGIAITEYTDEEPTVVEYQTFSIYVEEESVLEEENVEQIRIREVEDAELEEVADNPLISPIYQVDVVKNEDGQSEVVSHTEFDKDFIGIIEYDEQSVPEGFPEQDLGVYYFDPMWGKWFLIKTAAVDIEHNHIYFATNHFTDFSVQPTALEDISPQEIQDVGFSPFKSYSTSGDVIVSPQGGSVMSEVTELVLPGKNNFDFILKRTYDSSTARGDAIGLTLAGKVGINLTGVKPGFANPASFQNLLNWVITYLQSQGDYAYSTGLGWRLNIPYVRSSNDSVLVRLPNGSFYPVNQMQKTDAEYDPLILALLGAPARVLTFENHMGEDFKFVMGQIRVQTGVRNFWQLLSAMLILKDGTKYVMDALGRTTKIVSPDGLNEINISYDGLLMTKITDSMGRNIRFSYSTGFFVPRIKKIWVENDPYNREITYTYFGEDITHGALEQIEKVLTELEIPGSDIIMDLLGNLDFASLYPVMLKANDAGGRWYEYDYDCKFMFSAGFGIKVNILVLIGDVIAGVFGAPGAVSMVTGIDSLTLRGHLQTDLVFPLIRVTGPGAGTTEIEYVIQNLVYERVSGQDYFLGFIPTAIEFEVNYMQRMMACKLKLYERNGGAAIRTTTYDYKIKYYDHHQFLIYYTEVNNGKTITEYHYSAHVKRYLRWIDGFDYYYDLVPTQPDLSSLFTEQPYIYVVNPYNTEIIEIDASTQTVLNHSQLEWDLDTMRMTVQHKTWSNDKYEETEMEYDNWGNITYSKQKYKIKDRVSQVKNWMHYLNTNSQPSASAPWKSKPFSQGSLSRERYDLLAGKIVENTIPEIAGQATTQYIHNYYKYNSLGQMTVEALWCGNDWTTKNYEYHATHGSLIKQVNQEGHTTLYNYDYSSNSNYYFIEQIERNVLQPNGNTENIGSKNCYERISGWLAWEKNPRGYVTEYLYDSLGRGTCVMKPENDDPVTWIPSYSGINRNLSLLKTARPGNPYSVMEYDDNDIWVHVTDARGAVVTYDYDRLSRLVEIDKENRRGGTVEHSVTRIVYDGWHNIISIDDPNGFTTKYQYDVYNRNSRVDYPSGPYKSMNMDYYHNEVTVKDERGNVTYETYDFRDRLVKQVKEGSRYDIINLNYYDSLGNKVVSIDGRNNKTITRYNEMNLPVLVIQPEAVFFENGNSRNTTPVTTYTYNKAGFKIKESINTLGEDIVTIYTVDGLGRTIRTAQSYTDYLGGQKSAVEETYYDGNGNEIRKVDQNNALLPVNSQKYYQYEYSARDQVITEIDPAGNKTTYSYDMADNRIGMTDPRGNAGKYSGDFTVIYSYDDLSRLIKAELPKGRGQIIKPEVHLYYDKRGNLIRRVEPDGSSMDYTYTPRNWVDTETSVGVRLSGQPVSYVKKHGYDAAGNETAVTEAGMHTTSKYYDEFNRNYMIKYPAGNFEEYTYDQNDNITELKDGVGNKTITEFDSHDRKVKITDAYDHSTVYNYDTRGNQTRLTDAKGNATYFGYDRLNRLIKETDPLGLVHEYGYDGVGNKIYSKDPNLTTGDYIYAPNNLLLSMKLNNIEKNMNQSVYFKYDESGDIISQDNGNVLTVYNCNENGDVSTYQPDPYSLVHSKYSSIKGETRYLRYEYDIMNRNSAIESPGGQRIEYIYNNLGQLESVPGFTSGSPEYNEIGLLKKLQAANGTYANYAYDGSYRLTNLHHGGSPYALKNLNISYDNANNIRFIDDSEFVYDKLNRLDYARVDGKFAVDVRDLPQEFGRLENDFNAYNTLTFPVEDIDVDMKYDYGAMSIGINLNNIYYVNKIEFNPANENHRIHSRSIGIYTSNSNGNDYTEHKDWILNEREDGIIEILFRLPVEAQYVKVHCYYDERVLSEEPGAGDLNIQVTDKYHTVNNSPAELVKVYYMLRTRIEDYEYDVKGNRTVKDVIGNETYRLEYEYYAGSDRLKSDGRYGYIWDDNGNLIQRGKLAGTVFNSIADFTPGSGDCWEYDYDLLNRLIAVRKSAESTGEITAVAEYVYNASNLRVMKNAPGLQPVYFTYDEQGNVLQEKYNNAVFNNIYVLGRQYARTENRDGKMVTLFYHTDHLGSTIMITDAEGKAVWQDDYTPFGERTGEAGFLHESVKFTGKDLDTDTNMYYFNARWYDPFAGRFISEDPIKDGMNWYVYANNNPLVFIDPDGLQNDYIIPRQSIITNTRPKIGSTFGLSQASTNRLTSFLGFNVEKRITSYARGKGNYHMAYVSAALYAGRNLTEQEHLVWTTGRKVSGTSVNHIIAAQFGQNVFLSEIDRFLSATSEGEKVAAFGAMLDFSRDIIKQTGGSKSDIAAKRNEAFATIKEILEGNTPKERGAAFKRLFKSTFDSFGNTRLGYQTENIQIGSGTDPELDAAGNLTERSEYLIDTVFRYHDIDKYNSEGLFTTTVKDGSEKKVSSSKQYNFED